MVVAIIILLVVIITILMIYNIQVYKKVQTFNNINQKVISLNILQEFMDAIGTYASADEKINQINRILIEKYEVQYSTIVVFDGSDYIVKASNVEQKHFNVLKNLHNEQIFKESITTATPKYITVNSENEKLPYQKIELGRAKSAMFFPLYIDNVYIGYWIIESSQIHAFDYIDTTILEVVKENIVSALKTIANQNTIESIVRKDLFTGLNSAEYLYGKAKKIIDKYTISTVCMFRITNIEQINETTSRKLGDKVITDVSKNVQKNLSEEYIFVRYMGPKFVIVFSGVEPDGVVDFMKDIKKQIESLEISLEEIQQEEKTKKKKTKTNDIVSPKLNFVLTTYYKGTAIETVTKKLEEYIDNSDRTESNINYI